MHARLFSKQPTTTNHQIKNSLGNVILKEEVFTCRVCVTLFLSPPPKTPIKNSLGNVILKEEVFGPVLSVVQVATWDEALAIENANPFGNAACIYTTVGAHAEWFCPRFRAGMIG